jgi:hypothetical protein
VYKSCMRMQLSSRRPEGHMQNSSRSNAPLQNCRALICSGRNSVISACRLDVSDAATPYRDRVSKHCKRKQLSCPRHNFRSAVLAAISQVSCLGQAVDARTCCQLQPVFGQLFRGASTSSAMTHARQTDIKQNAPYGPAGVLETRPSSPLGGH